MNFNEIQASSSDEEDNAKRSRKKPVESIYSYTSEQSIPEKEKRPQLSSTRNVRTESVYSYTGEISQEIKNASLTIKDSAQNRKESAYSTTSQNFEKNESDEKKKTIIQK